jgi:hypothetical protein
MERAGSCLSSIKREPRLVTTFARAGPPTLTTHVPPLDPLAALIVDCRAGGYAAADLLDG